MKPACDFDEISLEHVQQFSQEHPGKIEILNKSFRDLRLEEGSCDLINASFSLPFCAPADFDDFWRTLFKALKPGGMISCELFGDRDGWVTHPINGPSLTFRTRRQIEKRLEGFSVKVLRETEEDAPTFGGPLKHWHLFSLIAEKPRV